MVVVGFVKFYQILNMSVGKPLPLNFELGSSMVMHFSGGGRKPLTVLILRLNDSSLSNLCLLLLL